MRLSDAFQEFVIHATLERCLEPTTIQWYNKTTNIFNGYLRQRELPLDVESLTVENLRDLFMGHRQRGNSPRAIINLMQGIRSFCVFLVKRGYLAENPFEHIEKPKLPRTLPHFLDEDESKELLQACINLKQKYKSRWARDVAIISLFLFTGIRKKELLNLRLKDVNVEKAYIRVSAKRKERLVPLNDMARGFLKDYLDMRPKRVEHDFVFLSLKTKEAGLTGQGLTDVFAELKEKVSFNKKISPQILRHTFCTLMLRNGVNLRDIQLLVGHSDISTTARFYLGCDEKQLKGAVDKHPLNF